jgi:hypothetical protein
MEMENLGDLGTLGWPSRHSNDFLAVFFWGFEFESTKTHLFKAN